MARDNYEQEYGQQYQPEVQKVIKLTLAFTKAVGNQQKDKSENVVVSAYNAVTALAMVAKGADGQTKEEFAQTLFGVPAKNLDAEAQSLANLNGTLLNSSKDKVTLTTANAVWANGKIVDIAPAYAKDIQNVFGADVSTLDFSNKKTPDVMNKWAADNTNGLIDKIVEELKPNDALVLASALYFKGEWTRKFDKKLTEDKAFTQDGGAELKLPTMQQFFSNTGDIRYLGGADYEAVAMTYGEANAKEGKRPPMRIVLVRPTDDSVSARDWLNTQDSAKVPAWLDAQEFEAVRGNVELPRLDIKQKHDLIPVLESMGVKLAFTNAANFEPMTVGRDPLKVDKVTHDVVFKTDEDGSEGAAVTTVNVMKRTSVGPRVKHVDVKLDRSFVMIVQDAATGTPIFAGVVNKPVDKDGAKPAAAKKAPKSKR